MDDVTKDLLARAARREALRSPPKGSQTCPACGGPARLNVAKAPRVESGLCAGCYEYLLKNQRKSKDGTVTWRERSSAQANAYDKSMPDKNRGD